MFKLYAKLGSENYNELVNIVNTLINDKCFDSNDKKAIIKLLERYTELSDQKSSNVGLFILIAQSAFPSVELSAIQKEIGKLTVENAAGVIIDMRPLQQIYVKSIYLLFLQLKEQNSNQKMLMDAMLGMLLGIK